MAKHFICGIKCAQKRGAQARISVRVTPNSLTGSASELLTELANKLEKREIINIVKELKKVSFVSVIVLFGSYATNRQTPLSDIDVCVITPEFLSIDKKALIYGYSSKKIDISLFWDLPLYIRYRAIKDGRFLFVRNKLALHRIKVKTILEYLDFKPHLERFVDAYLSKNV